MNNLNNLMKSEYDAMAAMNTPDSEFVSRALEMVRTKLTKKEYIEIEEYILKGYIYAEEFGFNQGFMRGIVVTKGGAV